MGAALVQAAVVSVASAAAPVLAVASELCSELQALLDVRCGAGLTHVPCVRALVSVGTGLPESCRAHEVTFPIHGMG